ncbi:hypothetical protein HanPI659440_Chr13g0486041 [Helianthus annuus]|nr:hypothetical protein HanPI659440_Chr13g0486041 [Helianthus annuus]
MRCKKHNTDLNSINDVCASCLCERLFKLILTRKQTEAQDQSQNNRNSNTNSPLPRSVSPYIHWKPVQQHNSITTVQQPSNKPHLNHSRSDKGFYNSPRIAVTSGGCIGSATATSSNNKKKKRLIRFSSLSNIFRSKGHDGDSDSIHGASVSTSGEPSGAAGKPTSVTSSPLWFSNVRPVSDRRQKKLSAIWENMCLC